MPVSQHLIDAKALINTPEKWTQGWYAKNAYGKDVTFSDYYAVCFCSLGALERVRPEGTPDAYQQAREILNKAVNDIEGYESTVHEFNDSHTHEEVMAMFDKAIELAKQDEQHT